MPMHWLFALNTLNKPNTTSSESGTMGPIEMPFGTFDYLGDLTQLPKFHRASPIWRGLTRGAKYPGRLLSFLMLLSMQKKISVYILIRDDT